MVPVSISQLREEFKRIEAERNAIPITETERIDSLNKELTRIGGMINDLCSMVPKRT